jgi:magnesium transporter
MLTLYSRDGTTVPVPPHGATARLPEGVVWIDLLRPDKGEVELVEYMTELDMPSFEELSEIESSSRLRAEDDVLYLSAPLLHRGDSDEPKAAPVGFVLCANRLITIRFEALIPFTTFEQSFVRIRGPHASAAEVFAGLIEAIVDRAADVLETIAAELDDLSHRLFRAQPIRRHGKHHPARNEADLRNSLRRVGHSGDLVSKIRDGLLALARIVPFVASHGAAWISPEVKPRLDTLRQDIASLSDYDSHLVNKVQLMLDATLGLINIEQNNIIKVLTVVSVVGVPPTLIASMYGMNFKMMPELEWAWGYPYALTLIALSAILPLLWFRRRGWF